MFENIVEEKEKKIIVNLMEWLYANFVYSLVFWHRSRVYPILENSRDVTF